MDDNRTLSPNRVALDINVIRRIPWYGVNVQPEDDIGCARGNSRDTRIRSDGVLRDPILSQRHRRRYAVQGRSEELKWHSNQPKGLRNTQ